MELGKTFELLLNPEELEKAIHAMFENDGKLPEGVLISSAKNVSTKEAESPQVEKTLAQDYRRRSVEITEEIEAPVTDDLSTVENDEEITEDNHPFNDSYKFEEQDYDEDVPF